MRHDVLYFRRMLSRAVDQHRPILLPNRYGYVAFEIEVVLAAHEDGSLQTKRGSGKPRRRRTTHEPAAGENVALCCQGCANVEDRGKLIIRNARSTHRFACRCIGSRGDRKHRLTRVLHQAIRKDRIIVYSSAIVILAGDIGGQRNCDDCRGPHDGCKVKLPNSSVRDAADAKSSMQGGRRQGDVVAVERLAGDMQMRTVVRMRFADNTGAGFVAMRLTVGTGTRFVTRWV